MLFVSFPAHSCIHATAIFFWTDTERRTNVSLTFVGFAWGCDAPFLAKVVVRLSWYFQPSLHEEEPLGLWSVPSIITIVFKACSFCRHRNVSLGRIRQTKTYAHLRPSAPSAAQVVKRTAGLVVECGWTFVRASKELKLLVSRVFPSWQPHNRLWCRVSYKIICDTFLEGCRLDSASSGLCIWVPIEC